MLNKELINYIQKEIFPIYSQVDKGHNVINHILPVINNSLSLSECFDELNKNIVYTVAAYHDVGLVENRKYHHIHSKEYVLQDINLRKWFTDEEINVIADAVEDHRASKKEEPRTIYGMIVADCDRSIDLKEIMFKTHNCLRQQYPEADLSTFDKEFEKAYEWIIEKNGEQGYMKFYVDKVKQKQLAELRQLIKDKNKLKKLYYEVYIHN